MYHTGLSLDWRSALGSGIETAGGLPVAGPAAPATPRWWEAPLGQAAQSAADWVSSELTDVPTYGGAPAFPTGTPGYQFYNEPDPILVAGSQQGGMGATAGMALLYVGGALLVAKVAGVF